MSTFTIARGLPSLRLSKELLAALERYIIDRVSEIFAVTVEDARKGFLISVDDSLGTERIASTDELRPSRFSDSTSRVVIEFDSPWRSDGPRVRIRLQFSTGRLYSSIAISATTHNPREAAVGIKEGIDQILEPHKTWHWLCYPTAEAWGTCIAAVAAIAIAIWQLNVEHRAFPLLLVAAFVFCIYGLQFASNLRPYTVFDSRAAERSDKIWSWAVGGVMTFLLFGTLLTFVRRAFLGY